MIIQYVQKLWKIKPSFRWLVTFLMFVGNSSIEYSFSRQYTNIKITKITKITKIKITKILKNKI